MAIEPKEAVKAAFEYLKEVSANSSSFSNFRVEELKKEGTDYLVTLSYEVTGEFPFDRNKEFKDFKVKAEDGTVEWMKIRKI